MWCGGVGWGVCVCGCEDDNVCSMTCVDVVVSFLSLDETIDSLFVEFTHVEVFRWHFCIVSQFHAISYDCCFGVDVVVCACVCSCATHSIDVLT